MKKLLLLALAMVFMGSLSAQNVEKDNNIAPTNGSKAITHTQGNFIGEDFLTGRTFNFNDTLAAGKAIIVDVFGFWCGPCWSFHTTHALEGLVNYSDCVPVMVECQFYTGSFTQADREAGIRGNQTNSQGDWTNGDTNPVTILAGASISASAFDTYTGQSTSSVPTLYMICPNGDVTEIARSTTAAGLHNNVTSCLSETDVPVVSISAPTNTTINNPVTFTANVRTFAPITSYSWTITGGSPASATTADVTTTFAAEGTYTVSVTVANANGSTTANHTINVMDCNNSMIVNFPYTEGFESTAIPDCWFTLDKDGDGYCWDTYNAITANISGAPAGSNYAHTGDNAMSAWSYYPTSMSSNGWVGVSVNSDEYLITPAISLPAGSHYKVSYWVRNFSTQYPDKYALKLSTTGMAEADFSTTIAALSAPTSSYTQKVHDLSAYAGQTIYLAFQHTGNDDFGMLLDDFYIGDNPTIVADAEISNVIVYPNPAKNQLFIQSEKALQQVEIYTMQGALVKVVNGNQNEINISNLSTGIYMVKAYTNEGVTMHKFIKE